VICHCSQLLKETQYGLIGFAGFEMNNTDGALGAMQNAAWAGVTKIKLTNHTKVLISQTFFTSLLLKMLASPGGTQ
jgi:hypothetical protein